MTARQVPGFTLQQDPLVVVARLPGKWLLERTTPSWRIKDPEVGFQRVVREDRTKEIAVNVLDQNRTFPNSIVLATDKAEFESTDEGFALPPSIRFLVVDGQHRLWAQHFSSYEAEYACVIHLGLSEIQMAYLFLEINDNQKRVPSSLRWDLVRLVRPEDDAETVAAADLVFDLATDEMSPLYQSIDLTGERKFIQLKQGSLAPGIRQLISGKAAMRGQPYGDVYDVLIQFLIAVRNQEPDDWAGPTSTFYKARVLRALLRLLDDILKAENRLNLSYSEFSEYLSRIDRDSLDPDRIKAVQGNAGIIAIHGEMRDQVFGAVDS